MVLNNHGVTAVEGFVGKTAEETIHNFRAPDLSRENFLGGPDIKGIYKNCRKIKRKFKMQQNL